MYVIAPIGRTAPSSQSCPEPTPHIFYQVLFGGHCPTGRKIATPDETKGLTQNQTGVAGSLA